MEPSSTAPPPILGTRAEKHSPSPETLEAEATVKDLADAPKADKKAMAVDHKLVIQEVQLLLAEKRTSFALLRTGVSVSLVPLSVWTVLIATSRLWNVWEARWLLAPLMLVALALFGLGAYLIMHAMQHLAHTDRVLMGLRQSDTLLEDLLIHHGRASRVVKPWMWRHHH
ncbi:MAG TPA: hypothetical protein VM582_10320 [Candidatus Thermoplasmatota archaeon]|nr:hypothetical protein [Candidatus Thermoplasmatota archaeon]